MYAAQEATEDSIYTPAVKKKKPNFFKRWLINSLKDVVAYDQELNNAKVGRSRPRGTVSIDETSIDLDREKSIQFRVYNASGGRVVETSRYDRTKDRNYTNLYVITKEQNFGHEIDKIITMEHLKQ